MKSLYLVLVLLGQFQIEELKLEDRPLDPLFLQEELLQPKKLDNRPHFDRLTANWCPPCKALGALLERSKKETLPFTYSDWNVDSRGYLGASSIPAWAYNGVIIQYGYSTPENLMENYRKAVLKSKAVTKSVQRLSPSQLKEFARTYSGPLRGVNDNNYWFHLQELPNHGFQTWQLNGLTQAECERIHGGQHYNYLTPFSIGGK